MDLLFGHTKATTDLQWKAQTVVRFGGPLLIEGETGTGKEHFARHLHDLRATGGQLVKFHCDFSPAAGAEIDDVLKAFEQARQDTFLLKRIHRLPMVAQERILHCFDRMKRPLPFLISTTSETVERLVETRQVIPELLYRISAYRLTLPPLRERRQEIPYLFRTMLVAHGELMESTAILDPAMTEALMNYSWPGNLRELENAAREFLLTPDLPEFAAEIKRRQLRISRNQQNESTVLKERVKQASKRVEGEIILRALEQHRWNRKRAAEALRISYRSLMYKMKSCDIRNENGMRRTMAHGK